MASFSINNYGENFVNIRVRPSSPYTSYRVYVKESNSGAEIYDEWWDNKTFLFDVKVDGLKPGTSYTVNVGYAMQSGAGVDDWLGSQEFTTLGGSGGTSTYYVTLRYRANGGSGAPATQEGETTNSDQYVTFRIPSSEPTWDGYTFLGWALDDDSATEAEYYPGDNITLWGSESGETYTLYAVWELSQDGYVYINDNGVFRAHEVYIYDGVWRRCEPYVSLGGIDWQKTTI